MNTTVTYEKERDQTKSEMSVLSAGRCDCLTVLGAETVQAVATSSIDYGAGI